MLECCTVAVALASVPVLDYDMIAANWHAPERARSAKNSAAIKVAFGRSAGKIGSGYVKERVDKACLNVRIDTYLLNSPRKKEGIKIGLTANLIEPYAVFLRKAA